MGRGGMGRPGRVVSALFVMLYPPKGRRLGSFFKERLKEAWTH